MLHGGIAMTIEMVGEECPRCGGKHIVVTNEYLNTTVFEAREQLDWVVLCKDCGQRTWAAFTRDKAVDKWTRGETF